MKNVFRYSKVGNCHHPCLTREYKSGSPEALEFFLLTDDGFGVLLWQILVQCVAGFVSQCQFHAGCSSGNLKCWRAGSWAHRSSYVTVWKLADTFGHEIKFSLRLTFLVTQHCIGDITLLHWVIVSCPVRCMTVLNSCSIPSSKQPDAVCVCVCPF